MTLPAAAAGERIRVRLCDLGLAPENLRAGEPADEAVPRLAETIRAAGLIYPPLVRRGRRGESAYMVLDGRRRRFALLRLAEAGEIPHDQEVECLLVRDRAGRAAATVLPNAEHAPVHLADVIAAIGRMRRARMDAAAVAEALGYDLQEIRRLMALAGVHGKVLEAFRAGRLTLRQVRMFARLEDRGRQAELAQSALDGWFQDWQLHSLVQGGRVTDQDPRFALVGRDRYAEAGGRLKEDLFGELPAEVLDEPVLDELWRGRAAGLAHGLAAEGLAVLLTRERGLLAPDGLASLPFVHWGALCDEDRAAFDVARARIEAALQAAASAGGEARDEALREVLAARLGLARLSAAPGAVEAVLLSPARDGLDATFYHRPAPAEAGAEAPADRPDEAELLTSARPEITVPPVTLEITGVSHVQHAARTDMATRGLVADLAEDPRAALVAVTAQLFKQLALRDPQERDASALRISAARYGEGREDAPDGPVWARLAARREAYLASGERPIGFVAGLADAERLALLAELAAASLDLREARTTGVRRAARAEAAEIAALCGAGLARRWTPDAAFLEVCSKAQLLGFLGDMCVEDRRAAGMKKPELMVLVAEAAAARGWVPAWLRWPHEDAAGDLGSEAPAEAA